jgi:hypothetical protein
MPISEKIWEVITIIMARNYYTQKGVRMAKVRKVVRTSSKPTGKWEVNEDTWKKNLRELGIENPQNVRVFRTSRIGEHGHCSPRMKNNVRMFHITTNKFLNKEEATKVLLHELRHVWQFQQIEKEVGSDRSAVTTAWNKKCREESYLNRPIEIDARRAEKRWREFPDLVKIG